MHRAPERQGVEPPGGRGQCGMRSAETHTKCENFKLLVLGDYWEFSERPVLCGSCVFEVFDSAAPGEIYQRLSKLLERVTGGWARDRQRG